MTTFRVVKDKDNPYVMMNKHFIYDDQLSFKAKGILSYIFSRPDDWQIYETEIVKHAKDKKDAVKTGIKELLETGYISRTMKRAEKGKFGGYEYEVYEIPHRNGFTATENPTTDNPTSGNPQLLNNESTNNDSTNNSTTTTENAFSFYEQNFGQINGHLSQDIGAWLDDFNGQHEILIEAMKIAIDRNKRSWGYTKAILKDWHSKNVKSVQDALALQQEFKPKVNIGTHTKQNGGQRNERTQQNNGNVDTSEYDDLSL
ncbi:DnaD domain protein [Priestia flexa]|uniref:DnaD domain protein n=1 Tax=Priestia flexa TaxID=86664 RepID=UPI000C2450D8|nr:DnaD domain protein [Priestia flexa]MEC0666324.1 DnaD domain protein [Priestia flexa]